MSFQSRQPVAVALLVFVLAACPVAWAAWRLHQSAVTRDQERFAAEAAKPAYNLRSWLVRLRQQAEMLSASSTATGTVAQAFRRDVLAIPVPQRVPDVLGLGLLNPTGGLIYATTQRSVSSLVHVALSAEFFREQRVQAMRFTDGEGAPMLLVVAANPAGRNVFILTDWSALLERAIRLPQFIVEVTPDPPEEIGEPRPFVRLETVEEAGIAVRLRTEPKAVFWRDSQRPAAWIAASAGGCVSLLLAVLAGALAARRGVLERRVRERTAELESANEQLRRAVEHEQELQRMKTEFISLVTHELRTPLQTVATSADILHRYDDLPPEQKSAQLAAITTAVRRMSGLSEEVLLFSRLEAGKIAPSPVALDLADWIRRFVADFPTTDGRVQVVLAELPPAQADERLLRHILANLLDNALKYSPAEKLVSLEVRRDGADAVFLVADHGPGIPPDDLPKLLSGFHRGANVLHIPGTGLGLVVVQRCVQLCGGTIRIENDSTGGARVTVRLPLFPTDA